MVAPLAPPRPTAVRRADPDPPGYAATDRVVVDEVTLVRRAAAGDRAAFEDLHRRYEQVVTAVVGAEMRRGHQAADRDDVVQEVFALAWLRLGGLRDRERFRPWLLQIARRMVIDHARWHERRPVLDGDDERALGRLGDRAAGPEELAELADLARRLRRGLAGMTERDAAAILLAAHLGLGPREIGDALGITPGNAKVVLHRARARLRSLLDA